MLTCLRCNWTLNSPIKGDKISELLGVSMQWAGHKGVKGLRSLRRQAAKMIGSYKDLNSASALAICRHCVMETVSLLLPDWARDEFNKELVYIYSFSNSIIY